MIGYMYVKQTADQPRPDPQLIVVEGPNGWVVMCESEKPTTEHEARKQAATDLIAELRDVFPGNDGKHFGLVSFCDYNSAAVAANYISDSWQVCPQVLMKGRRCFYLGWQAEKEFHAPLQGIPFEIGTEVSA